MLIRIACIYQRIACTTNTAPSGWVHGLYTYHIFTCICLCILHLHMYIYVIFYEVTVGLLYGIFCIYTLCLYMYVFVLARIFTICVCMNVYSQRDSIFYVYKMKNTLYLIIFISYFFCIERHSFTSQYRSGGLWKCIYRSHINRVMVTLNPAHSGEG